MRRFLPAASFLGLAWVFVGGSSPLGAQANNLTFDPPSLSFSYQVGAPRPAKQTLNISTTGAPLAFRITGSTLSGQWLEIAPVQGTTPAAIDVFVSPTGLAPGIYEGTINVTAAGAANSGAAVRVTLSVVTLPQLAVSPAAAQFYFQVGGSTPPSQTLLITSGGSQTNFTASAATSSGGPWLIVAVNGGTTPSAVSLSVNPAGLSPGSYSGSVTVIAAGAASQTVSVSLTVSVGPLLYAASGPLTFYYQSGGLAPPAQSVALASTGAPLTFTASATTTGGIPWLVPLSPAGTTPAALSVAVNPQGLFPGTYSGSLVLSGSSNQATVPVTLVVGSTALLNPAPGSVNFSFDVGGPPPGIQAVAVTSTSTALGFTVSSATVTGGGWMMVTSSGIGITPFNLTIAANPAGLPPGTYTGTITIAAQGAANSPLTIPVTLTVNGLVVTPATLAFNYRIGEPAPPAQSIGVLASGAALGFSATAAVSGGNWLSVAPQSGTTPAQLAVTVNPAGLAAGNYTGAVAITAAVTTNSQTVTVSLGVTGSQAGPQIAAVVNAASFASGAVAPGEIVTLFGTGIGPSSLVTLRLTASGSVDTTLADTRVLFDGVAAPLVYVSSTQTSAIVPYAVAGRPPASVQVEYQGVRSSGFLVPVAPTAPGLFTLNSSGSGAGAILNQDFSVNSAARPALKGSVVQIYGTGEGQTDPPGIDGLITGSTLRRVLARVSVTIGGQDAEVQYAGSAPGLVAGVLQVNAKVPASAPSGAAVPVVVTIGGIASQTGVTVAVQ